LYSLHEHPNNATLHEEAGRCLKLQNGWKRGDGPSGKPALAPETLAAICAERRKYPDLTLAKLAQHLYDTGIYRATSRQGASVPVNPDILKVWLDNAQYKGLP